MCLFCLFGGDVHPNVPCFKSSKFGNERMCLCAVCVRDLFCVVLGNPRAKDEARLAASQWES